MRTEWIPSLLRWEEEMRRGRKLRGRSFCAHRVRKMWKMMRSRRAGTVWDSSSPESDSCCVSHGAPSSLLWLTAEQKGYLRNKHQSLLAWNSNTVLVSVLKWPFQAFLYILVCSLQMASHYYPPMPFSHLPSILFFISLGSLGRNLCFKIICSSVEHTTVVTLDNHWF